jgi:hypothetical protein
MDSLQVAENQFRYALATGNLPAVQIAQFRRIWELMLDDRTNGRYISYLVVLTKGNSKHKSLMQILQNSKSITKQDGRQRETSGSR